MASARRGLSEQQSGLISEQQSARVLQLLAQAAEAPAAKETLAPPAEEASAALSRVCGSQRWVQGMVTARPFRSRTHLYGVAGSVWWHLGDGDFVHEAVFD